MCNVIHEIELTNIKNDHEYLTHEILLISGIVPKRCKNQQNVTICIARTKWLRHTPVSRQGHFKILCQVQLGEQEIEIEYCTKKVQFKCTLTRSANPFQVQPLYIVCQDDEGRFNSTRGTANDAAEACKIIDLNLKLVQSLYAEKLNETHLGRKTFTLRSGCEVFKSNLKLEFVKKLDEHGLWKEFGREILNSKYRDSKLKFVAFISCTKYERILDNNYSYDNIKKHTKAHAALGAGGLAIFGSGYFYSWPRSFDEIIPCFKNEQKLDLRYFLDDSNYRRTFGGVFATTLGAVCHEIGHIFDLGHTTDGIMGSGFDYMNRVFTVDNLTENLPNRLVGGSTITTTTSPVSRDNRLTKIQRNPCKFLDKYHEQKESDCFNFTRSSAVILATHRWLCEGQCMESCHIKFELKTRSVLTEKPIRLIELRDRNTSLFLDFFEFPEDTTECILPSNYNYHNEVSVYVICNEGTAKLFELEK